MLEWLEWILESFPYNTISLTFLIAAVITSAGLAFFAARLRWRPRRKRHVALRGLALFFCSFATFVILGLVAWYATRDYRALHWGVELSARPIVRRGDPVVLKLKWNLFPEGITFTVEQQFHATSLKIAGKDFPVDLKGGIREVPNWATQGAFPGYQVVELPADFVKTLQDGPVPVNCIVELTVRCHDKTLTRHEAVSTSFKLVPETVETIKVVTTRPHGMDEEKCWPVSVRQTWSKAGEGRGLLVWLMYERPNDRYYRNSPHGEDPPIPPTVTQAGDLSIRIGDKVLPLGQFPPIFPIPTYQVDIPEGQPVPDFVDITLTPNRGAAVRTMDIDTIWGEPITFPHQPVEKLPTRR